MIEAEWLTCTDPAPMLEYLREKGSERKLRLFAVACCRSIWDLLSDARSRRAVEFAEQSADEPISTKMLDKVSGQAEEAFEDMLSEDEVPWAASAASYASNPALRECGFGEILQGAARASTDPDNERALQVKLVHDIFGQLPFRPITINPAWLTTSVVALAQTIYDERTFGRLPTLADALIDAGCGNQDILDHCRSEGPHVRGCWVVDLVLGKG